MAIKTLQHLLDGEGEIKPFGYATVAVLDTGKLVETFRMEYDPNWAPAPDTTYIAFQEPVYREADL